MIDILLIDEDVNYIKKFINDLSNYNKNIRISTCITNISEIKDNINKYSFDIIILDFNLLDVFEKYLYEYKNYLILNVQKNNINAIDLNFPFFYKSNRTDIINSTILETLENKLNNELIRDAIKEELKYLGYNPKYYGTKYLIEAIYILYMNGINNDDNLKKVVYPIISQKYNKSIQNIKCNIINSTDTMVCECEEKKLIEYLGFFDYSKPGPKKIIESVLNNINRKFQNIIK